MHTMNRRNSIYACVVSLILTATVATTQAQNRERASLTDPDGVALFEAACATPIFHTSLLIISFKIKQG